MSTILNVLWLIFGGLITALSWYLLGLLLAITVIGLPWAFSAFRIGGFVLWPFGRESVDRELHTGDRGVGTGALGFVGNVIWFLLAGIWLFLEHLALAVAQAVTIIGIPFALQNVKIAILALAPIGKTIRPIR